MPTEMTAQEQIEYLATKVMGWTWINDVWSESPDPRQAKYVQEGNWNPVVNWNHWRQIEEKILMTADSEFFSKFLMNCAQCPDQKELASGNWMFLVMLDYMASTLQTRATALISAHQYFNEK